MPSLSVKKRYLETLMQKSLDNSDIENILFDFGVELDDIYEEDGETMYKVDIAANRFDLLCAEGLSSALRCYMGEGSYSDVNAAESETVVHRFSTHERSSIACAIIRNIDLSGEKYDSLISYQDKLHSSIGKNRSLAAIGTHDLEKIKGPVVYRSTLLSEINFVPLRNKEISQENSSKNNINGRDLKAHFEKDKKISKYFDLLSDGNKMVNFAYLDGNASEIMSVPPIINSDATKISRETKNIFVEVTGNDINKVSTVLKLILGNFRGSSCEIVGIVDHGEETPEKIKEIIANNAGSSNIKKAEANVYKISTELVEKRLKIKLSAAEIKALLEKMMFTVEISDNKILNVFPPSVRSDILHEIDVSEDIAIAYGYNNFNMEVPEINTVGSEDPLNKFCDKLRQEMALCGFNEGLTLTLLSRAENFVEGDSAAVLSNPKSREYEVVRTSLMPGLLKMLASNLHGRIPIRIFEVADAVRLSGEAEGASNIRLLCALIAGRTSMLEELQGPLSLLMEKCGISNFSYEHIKDEDSTAPVRGKYLKNQCAEIFVNGKLVGDFGVLHPVVCNNFKIPYAGSALEIDVEKLFSEFKK
ncbi:phenylalanyl-tRNA synthetase beta chain [Enteropsectra breve]|nr:phenylalanyl-tRNA synthetase beta chain [Enteropsectra breve]